MDAATLRADMVDGLEHALGGLDGEVAVAMRTVPREAFVPEAPYDNRSTEHAGSRVLAPETAARLTEALAPGEDDRVLVVGSGVGYTAAVLAELVGARNVHAVDIARRLVLEARSNLAEAGYEAVLVDCRDGADGLPEYAPFDRVLLEAAAVRPPRALVDQLAPGGRLVMPRGGPEQTLVAVEPPGGPSEGPPDGVAAGNGGGSARREAPGRVVDEFGPAAFRPMLVSGEEGGGPARNRTEREERERAGQGYFAPTGWELDWIDWDERL